MLDNLINQERKDYKCFNLLKELYNTNDEFKQFIDEGVSTGNVEGFQEELWKKIDEQNVMGIDSFEQIFQVGYNIGGCTRVAKQLSYSFRTCELCSGLLPIIKGTKNSENGEHTWITSGNKVYDTTLMIIINSQYAQKLGYITEAHYDPHTSEIYRAGYEFANDPELRGLKR